MTSAERLFCDTNVLLSAVDKRRANHAQALHVLNTLPNQGIELCLSGQVVREFLGVSTRATAQNGLGQPATQALDNIHAILARSTLLEETREVTNALRALVRQYDVTGKQVHDANIVASLTTHGLRRLCTDNLGHFARFRDIELVDLSSMPTR